MRHELCQITSTLTLEVLVRLESLAAPKSSRFLNLRDYKLRFTP